MFLMQIPEPQCISLIVAFALCIGRKRVKQGTAAISG
jgi:hypothetical protein